MSVLKSDFTTGSGVLTAVSDRVSIGLNEYGQYEYRLPNNLSKRELDMLYRLDSLRNADEDRIGGQLYGSQDGIDYDSILGYFSDLYCGYVEEGNYRANATSGGLATWLLVQLLEEGLVDGVVCVGESEKSGILYEYKVLKTADEIRAHAKSRYYPMELSEVLEFIAKNEGKYAIVGIPSFISDIRRLQEVDTVFAERICFVIALLCGHQKTAKYGEAIALEAGFSRDEIDAIDFRFKIEDGRANDYVTEIVGRKNGERRRVIRSPGDNYVHNWGAGMFKANFSDYVDDCFGETADVSLGDAWLPKYSADGRGTSVVVVRNPEIRRLIRRGLNEGRLVLDAVDSQTVKSSQTGMIRQYRGEINYRLFRAGQKGIHIQKRITPSRDISRLRRRVQDLRMEIALKSKVYFLEAENRNDWSYFERKMAPLMKKYHRAYRLIYLRDMGLEATVRRALKGLLSK
ncbi:coenzyme F420 hydrogenase/dehydrogenase beta subunit N-terminal domain-containing protein [Nesterenkonia jeotgali]|uniref:Coenzyme F420 hydrogenase n=1 Tax=Nesterenkonia jeotgali TaxID=317018 RepID=A0A0W8IE49_9MICC|nr:coenzyme F420 hydrogenase/dehydrogenase beta subunit N-terminal domain-containing protein [Nesterenkonia jeotgali]KUG58193.1 hypothetical protein AVL63_06915 [Nesterenkonia jeotgali]